MASKAPSIESIGDLYQVLGVEESASDKEIKAAYRQRAQECHPDTNPGKKEKFLRVQFAYETLRNEEKRAAYDRYREEQGQIRTGVEGSRRTGSSTTFESMFKDFTERFARGFGNMDLFSGTVFDPEARSFFSGTDPLFASFGAGAQKAQDYFKIPENDLGLLAALIQAYQAKEDGEWKVNRVKTNQRTWLPERLYLVKKEGSKVTVSRNVADWQESWDRGKPIVVYDEETMENEVKRIDADYCLGEDLLCEGKTSKFRNVSINFGFRKYLTAIKALADKVAHSEGREIDIDMEAMTINGYALNCGYTRSKKDMARGLLTDRELLREIPFSDLDRELMLARDRVFRINGERAPEGQAASGESKN